MPMLLTGRLGFNSRIHQRHSTRHTVKLGTETLGFGSRAACGDEGQASSGRDTDCRICATTGDLRVILAGSGSGSGQFVSQIGGFSHESEHDLAVMVSDFMENGSGGADSRCSSDSESGFSDLAHLYEKILFHKHIADQYESDLLSAVHSNILSINETDLQCFNDGPCNASCIRLSLVKLLRFSGYDAAVCISKWQNFGKVPGGDHEYIDVVVNGSSERLIIDIDFRSHFEIARAVESYDTILNSLPVVYVGSQAKLIQFLQIMVDAARSSLKQNSMPLPPWRSLAYLQAKWHSPYERKLNINEWSSHGICSTDHKQCIGHMRRLKASLQSEMETEHLLKPIINDNNRRLKLERWRHSLYIS